MYEKENTVREWKVYIFVLSLMIVCAVAMVIFEPEILFSPIVLRGFDAFISFVLLAIVFLEEEQTYSICFRSFSCH
ncbi:hypothetical protein V8B27_09405 [Bacillus inaquosorum]|nr:hypothetical protein [Bacillus sp. TSO22]